MAKPVPAATRDELDLRGLAQKAANDGLKRMGAHLDPDRLDDLTSHLVIVALRAQKRYDPSYGQAESTYLYRRMRPRVVDWFRQTMGDSRFRDPALDPRSAIPLGPDRMRDLRATDTVELQLEDSFATAVERLGYQLTDEARDTLERVARPIAEHGYTKSEMSKRLGFNVQPRLARLRDELAGEGDGRIVSGTRSNPLHGVVLSSGR